MKKTLKIALCLVLVLSSLLCLTACGDDKKEEPAGADITGMYGIFSMSEDGETMDKATLDLIGMNASNTYILISGNGVASFSLMGEIQQMGYAGNQMWPADDPTDKATFVVAGNILTLTQGSSVITFMK